MSNGNEPAYPMFIPPNPQFGSSMSAEFNAPKSCFGLTKREYLAGLAMQGLIAAHTVDDTSGAIAIKACACADALLAELDKEQK